MPGEVVLQQKAQPNSAMAFGVNPRSVRLHVGLEGTEALWSDLEAAIAAASQRKNLKQTREEGNEHEEDFLSPHSPPR